MAALLLLLLVDTPQIEVAKSMRASDTLIVTLSVEGGKKLEVRSPDPRPDARLWTLVDAADKGSKSRLPNGRWRWQRRLELDPTIPGKEVPLPEIELMYRDGPGEWRRHTWTDLTVEVVASDGVIHHGEVGIETLPPRPQAARIPWRELALAITILIVLGCGLWWWRRPRQTLVIPPDVRALLALKHLYFAPEATVHESVSDVLRRFLEERFGLVAPRRTSEELLPLARLSDAFPPSWLEPLAELLAECDRIRFANGTPSRAECDDLVTRASHFVEANSGGNTDQ